MRYIVCNAYRVLLNFIRVSLQHFAFWSHEFCVLFPTPCTSSLSGDKRKNQVSPIFKHVYTVGHPWEIFSVAVRVRIYCTQIFSTIMDQKLLCNKPCIPWKPSPTPTSSNVETLECSTTLCRGDSNMG